MNLGAELTSSFVLSWDPNLGNGATHTEGVSSRLHQSI